MLAMMLNLEEQMTEYKAIGGNVYQKELKLNHKILSYQDVPHKIPELLLEIDSERVIDIIPQLIQLGMVNDTSQLIRLIRQDAVKINNELLFEDELDRVLMNDEILQIGTKKFLRIIK